MPGSRTAKWTGYSCSLLAKSAIGSLSTRSVGRDLPMIDTVRLARAVHLEVQPVGPGRYLVRGGADDHVVEVDGGRVMCHCPDAERMGDGCKHSLALRLRAGDGEVVDALRELVGRPDGRQGRRTHGTEGRRSR